MGERLNLIKEIEKQFETLIVLTNDISENVNKTASMESITQIVNGLNKRDGIIAQINSLQARIKDIPEDSEESQEYEKHHWLCRELAKKLQEIDQANVQAMNNTLNTFMENIRSTKQSIRAVKAYNMQGAR